MPFAFPESSPSKSIFSLVREGLILQRSGEELSLEKWTDRFTIQTMQLLSGDSVSELASRFNLQVGSVSTSRKVIEFQTESERLDTVMEAFRQLEEVAFASHVYQMQWSPGTAVYLTNQLTIQFAEAVDGEEIRSIASEFGLRVLKLIPGVAKAFVFEVTNQATANPIKLANRLMLLPEVVMAEPNIMVPVQTFCPSMDQALPLTGSALSAELNAASHKDLHSWQTEVWQVTQGMRSIVVAVAEQNMGWNLPAFQGLGKIVAPVNWEADPQEEQDAAEQEPAEQEPGALQPPSPPLPDASSTAPEATGTLFAELAVASKNPPGRGTPDSGGVAPNCALMPIEMGDLIDDHRIEQVFEWATEQGAAVLYCGWGARTAYFPLSLRQRTAIMRTATQGRGGLGCVVIFAVGDESSPVDGIADERGLAENGVSLARGEGATKGLNGFAMHPDVIAVAACKGSNPGKSNWGSAISVCAEAEGTGAAGAIVAGVVALMLSVNSDLTSKEVRQILQDSADRIASEPELQTGQPYLHDGRGHSQRFGYGKVNGVRAVQMAQHRYQPAKLPNRWVYQQQSMAIEIPDYTLQGISSTIEMTDDLVGAERVQDIQVGVDIEHAFMSDIAIYLLPPQGGAVLLQGRTLGRLTMLRKTFSPANTPLLRSVLKHPAMGSWQLKLVDHARLSTGKLKSWELHLGL